MKQDMTMGSLFSGSGGFELASAIFGIEPKWASEIEPLPILITKKNFPEMPHLGDIHYMNGGKVEPVTVIAGGSPCQVRTSRPARTRMPRKSSRHNGIGWCVI